MYGTVPCCTAPYSTVRYATGTKPRMCLTVRYITVAKPPTHFPFHTEKYLGRIDNSKEAGMNR